jgi:sialic acid synthase SpsE
VCIEKHYTLDKSLPDVPDHAMSVDPSELATLVEMCNRGARLRGDAFIGIRESEMPARLNARRSIVLARPLSAGSVIAGDDLDFKRPGAGMPPFRAAEVIGRTVVRDLGAEHVLTDDDLR